MRDGQPARQQLRHQHQSGTCCPLLHPVVILDDHDQIDAFHTDLQSPAPAFHIEKRRGAPSTPGAAGRHSPAALRAEHKSALHQVRHHRDAPCMVQQFLRNAFIGRSHDLSQYRARMLKSVVGILRRLVALGQWCEVHQRHNQESLSHHIHPYSRNLLDPFQVIANCEAP